VKLLKGKEAHNDYSFLANDRHFSGALHCWLRHSYTMEAIGEVVTANAAPATIGSRAISRFGSFTGGCPRE